MAAEAKAAQQRGARQEEMVKSILLRDRRRYVASNAQLDPKAVREAMAGLELRPSGLIRLAKAILGPIARAPDIVDDRQDGRNAAAV